MSGAWCRLRLTDPLAAEVPDFHAGVAPLPQMLPPQERMLRGQAPPFLEDAMLRDILASRFLESQAVIQFEAGWPCCPSGLCLYIEGFRREEEDVVRAMLAGIGHHLLGIVELELHHDSEPLDMCAVSALAWSHGFPVTIAILRSVYISVSGRARLMRASH